MIFEMEGVSQLTERFDTQKLRAEYARLREDEMTIMAQEHYDQIGLTWSADKKFFADMDPVCSATWKYAEACGSLLQSNRKTSDFQNLTVRESDYPYLVDTIMRVRDVAGSYGRRVGRVRFMTLRAKTCLSLHRDLDEFRLHIPVHTSGKAFFVVDDKIKRMPNEGSLYAMYTRAYHTAVNGHESEHRTHLVFDIYQP